MSRLIRYSRKLLASHVSSPGPSVDRVRQQLLFGILLGGSALGLLAYLPSVVIAWRQGFFDLALLDTLLYVWVLGLTFIPALSFLQRAIGLIVPAWSLAIYLLFLFGHNGAGFLWLLVPPMLGGLLIGTRTGVLLTLLNVIVLLGFWTLTRHPASAPVPQPGETGTELWTIMAGNFVLINALLTTSIAAMMRGLQSTLKHLEAKNHELALTQDVTIGTVANLVEYRDTDTGNHILRTREYLRILGERLAQDSPYATMLTPGYIDLLCRTAPLHDIGKVGIPDAILRKGGALSAQEFELMKQHTVYGRDALLSAAGKLGKNNFLHLAAEIAYTHQERWDGSGYPQGLAGEQIPLSGRLMAVADVYDALTTRRPYKPALPHEEALGYIRMHSGSLFDPHIVEALEQTQAAFRQTAMKYLDNNMVAGDENLDIAPSDIPDTP